MQYLLLEICMELDRRSSSSAIFFGILIPMVWVPLPIAFVTIFFLFFFLIEYEMNLTGMGMLRFFTTRFAGETAEKNGDDYNTS